MQQNQAVFPTSGPRTLEDAVLPQGHCPVLARAPGARWVQLRDRSPGKASTPVLHPLLRGQLPFTHRIGARAKPAPALPQVASQAQRSWQWWQVAMSSPYGSTCTVHEAKPNLVWSWVTASRSTISGSTPGSGDSKAAWLSTGVWTSTGAPWDPHPCPGCCMS